MIKYTTPTFTLTVPVVLTDNNVYITFSQKDVDVTKKVGDTGVSMTVGEDSTVISCMLSQSESSEFSSRVEASVQVNWINSSGVRCATQKKYFKVYRNNLDSEVTYE